MIFVFAPIIVAADSLASAPPNYTAPIYRLRACKNKTSGHSGCHGAVQTNSDPLHHVGDKEGRTPPTHGNQTRVGGASVAKRLKRTKLAHLNLRRRDVSVGVPGGAVNY